jgi:hypothetical protein
VNILQARILEVGKKRTDTCPRSTFLVLAWSADNQSGEIADSTGFRFGVTVDDLSPECEGSLPPGERVSGIVDGPAGVNILIETGPHAIGNIPAERAGFDSVGAGAGSGTGWNPHRGTPGTGRIRLGK